jgi:hypothetical protein
MSAGQALTTYRVCLMNGLAIAVGGETLQMPNEAIVYSLVRHQVNALQ